LSLTLLPIIGLAGIPLSAALTFTPQAIVLLVILNRRFPGLLQMGDTATRALLAAATAGLVSWTVLTFLPFSAILRTFASLLAGGLICLPFIWREIRLLFNL
ncbi:MAG: hypothetical protein MUO77_02510, partial [Anaerolineales bacterium]|nr:hypothetical protein [Anaerolineales bacterium]